MKKLATLLLAASMVIGASTGASAIDFKAKGEWIMNFDYGQNGAFMGSIDRHKYTGWGKGGQDEFEATQRVRLQLDAVASEQLSGTAAFQIGGLTWGNVNQGGGLDTNQPVVRVRLAYIDWMIPATDAKVRMGLQQVTLPSFTTGSTIMDDWVAGVTVNVPITEMVGVTAIWMRPYNDNYAGRTAGNNVNYTAGYLDNMDLFGLLVPLTFDGAKVTPWGMYGAIGPNTFATAARESRLDEDGELQGYDVQNLNNSAMTAIPRRGLFPVAGARHRNFSGTNDALSRKLNNYGNAWWAGLTGEVTVFDPFRVAWDFSYGSITWDSDGRLNRQGWLANLLVEYKMDWAIPGLYAWYGSGDDANPANGSERMPTISESGSNKFSDFAFSGASHIVRDQEIGRGMSGTWGIGARLKDMSFIEDLKHTFAINLIGGTNSPTMAKKMSKAGLWANGYNFDGGTASNMGWTGMYLTTLDHALEFNLKNTYKMYENFNVEFSANYIAMWLDTSKSVWGARHTLPLDSSQTSIPQTKDAWNFNVNFTYSF